MNDNVTLACVYYRRFVNRVVVDRDLMRERTIVYGQWIVRHTPMSLFFLFGNRTEKICDSIPFGTTPVDEIRQRHLVPF